MFCKTKDRHLRPVWQLHNRQSHQFTVTSMHAHSCRTCFIWLKAKRLKCPLHLNQCYTKWLPETKSLIPSRFARQRWHHAGVLIFWLCHRIGHLSIGNPGLKNLKCCLSPFSSAFPELSNGPVLLLIQFAASQYFFLDVCFLLALEILLH